MKGLCTQITLMLSLSCTVFASTANICRLHITNNGMNVNAIFECEVESCYTATNEKLMMSFLCINKKLIISFSLVAV